MTVEVYLCKKFQHTDELKPFGLFLQEMIDRFQESEDLYMVIGEPEANTASMDMIILTHRALIIVELKSFIYAEGVEIDGIDLFASENGDWIYSIQGGSTYHVGKSGKDRNPYQQIKRHSYLLGDWLTTHSNSLPGGPWNRKEAIRKIYTWVVISPGFNTKSSNIDLPWSQIKKWFKVLPFDKLAWEIGMAANPNFDLTDEHMVGIAEQFGAKKCNPREFVPNYVRPTPRVPYFGTPPISKQFIDRHDELSWLFQCLEDPHISIISIGGPGGIGKTYTAAHFIEQVRNRELNGLWVDCSEREVTRESFLAAVADKIQDKHQAAIIQDPDQNIFDRYDLALEYLDSDYKLVVFNEFHKVPSDGGLEDFFSRVIQKATNLKILLTTSIRPNCLDDPNWPRGTWGEKALDGIPIEFLSDYIQSDSFSDDQLTSIWEKTSGNPYAIGLLMSMLRNRNFDKLDDLPLFDDTRAKQWADSLIETLDNEAKSLAWKLAVVRTSLGIDLIERLSYSSEEKTSSTLSQLVDAYVLQEVAPENYQMQDYIREALISNASEKDLKKAHGTAGKFFEQFIEDGNDSSEQSGVILQCLYHFEYAENWQGILTHAELGYKLFLNRGDRDTALSISEKAVKAAKFLKDNKRVIYWLIREINLELDTKQIESAKKHLNEAFNSIPTLKEKDPEDLKKQWQVCQAQLWIQKGRLLFFKSDLINIEDCFNKGLELAELAGDRSLMADLISKVGQIERYQGKYSLAKQHYADAGNLAIKIGDNNFLSVCISHLGLISREEGDLVEAKRLFNLAVEKAKAADDINNVEINRGLLGDIDLRLGDFKAAELTFREQLKNARSLGNRLGIRINLGWLAEALIGLNQIEEAESLLEEYAQRIADSNDELGYAWLLKRRGLIEQAKGNYDEGNELIDQGIEKLKEINYLVYISDFKKALITTPVPKQLDFLEESGEL